MYAVIRHTFEIVNPEPDNPKSYKIMGEWKHYVWLFECEEDAVVYAISLLDSPLLTGNKDYLNHAIESLQINRFFQVGKESVAIGEIQDSPEIIYKDILEERNGKNNIH